ncbi:MAG TPA: hypothetical protein DGH68_08220 [Bacteroidetes bacterium]|nr:hypothetical protein [Bacteroidota bacterium]
MALHWVTTGMYCVWLIPTILQAGERSNIRGMGMARTFVASSRGLDAVGINPANLAVDDQSTVTLSIMPFGGHVGSDFLDYDIYTKYFTGIQTDSGRVGRYLSEEDKKVILDSFTDPVARTTAEIEARILGVTYRVKDLGAVAFTITDKMGGIVDVPRDYVEFAFYGNPVGSSYNFDGAKILASWTREYGLSFGTEVKVGFLKSFGVGAAAKLVHGFSYYEVQRFNASLTTDEHATLTATVDFLSRRAGADLASARLWRSFRLFPEIAGKGMGFDLGARGEFNSYLSFGLSLTDIGSITWSKDTQENSVDSTIVVDDPLNEEQRQMVEDYLKGQRRSIGRYSTPLPTTLRMGVALEIQKIPDMEDMPGELLIELNYNQSLIETPYSTTAPRVSLGVEYKPYPWLPLRSGVSFWGTDYVNLALGFGISFTAVEFELASENVTWLFSPKSFSKGSISVGLRFRI